MGYTTTTNEKGTTVFCCDKCDSYPARVHKCPHSYCQKYYFCSTCWKEIKVSKWDEIHSKCKQFSNEHHARLGKEQELLDSGKFIRCSALNIDNGDVQIWFRNKEGLEISFIINEKAYRTIPLLTPSIIEDYANIENSNMVRVAGKL